MRCFRLVAAFYCTVLFAGGAFGGGNPHSDVEVVRNLVESGAYDKARQAAAVALRKDLDQPDAVVLLLTYAQAAYREGDYGDARDAALHVVTRHRDDPRHGAARKMLAEINGKLHEDVRTAPPRFAYLKPWQQTLVRSRHAAGTVDASIAAVRRELVNDLAALIDKPPDDGAFDEADLHDAMRQRFILLTILGQSDHAVAQLNRLAKAAKFSDDRVQFERAMMNVIRADHASSDQQAAEARTQAIDSLQALLKQNLTKKWQAESRLQIALQFEKLGRAEVKHYEAVWKHHPQTDPAAEARTRAGSIMFRAARQIDTSQRHAEQERLFHAAALHYLAAHEAQPKHKVAGAAQLLGAQCLVRAGRHDDALTAFDVVINGRHFARELRAEAMYWKGDCLVRKGREADAYKVFKALTETYPDTVWANYGRGRILQLRADQ